ncbi:uncharacterized protein BT62DRAFT_960247 [Guyanagaster necrorhizus]|uniref:non-specific serine/threonine protein kinase n=1 Tax=Guyanagaster necrorhizus TaxID=856835 RepID=A0A9P7W5B5_9AGAR|nr:uncharacterized protein BT62DRAFT_960247 [Guyanagaster necrorhizus MCA 3950]KAG7452220.1 hypothetical protein BT62DRAFT_960247 [Guyanagaster necrorhizus MCA 3950]
MATTATLVPGQNIAVNKFNVQVERYLSQGGFAHVYLVRTATPVYNTTHHVLKRIAVPNEGMLTEVKQEVDVMRLLKGHPNIVHLIDAAWHRLPNGTYEVFILMEFCPGGGIIDMMNRRLRERLTEAEILTIFVDVCEGVAHMHNSRPPLLHRDLKVENILQASATSYKLCDFGSAATVSKVPTNTQELRALEADLNRHTTLQYRAPEMVDLYLRRPVDEKSDVWALGVLLYKLCYYTTPFEEHGPLAILNVSYKIPPYPVYSLQMNALIASMLREHGTHRPSVFELLTSVHKLRGTVSSYRYNHNPAPQPLSPRIQSSWKPVPSPHPLDTTISYRAAPQLALGAKSFTPSPSPSRNAGLQARDKVLEAIAPMRRGRPTRDQDSGSTSSKEQWLNDDFGAEEEKAWKSAVKTANPPKNNSKDDAWAISLQSKSPATLSKGFGDDFATKLWDEFESGPSKFPSQLSSPRPHDTAPKLPARQPTAGSTTEHSKLTSSVRSKDAFEGLGFAISDKKPAPTLGEARKLRTGLAVISPASHSFGSSDFYNSAIRPSMSPRPSYLTLPDPAPLKPSGSGSSWSSQPPSSRPDSQVDSAAEARFPSLEELDAKFGGSGADSRPLPVPPGRQSPIPSRMGGLPSRDGSAFGRRVSSRLPQLGTQSYGQNKVRSEQVMSAAVQDAPKSIGDRGTQVERETGNVNGEASSAKSTESSFKRPVLIRKHHSSVTKKPSDANDLLESPSRGVRVAAATSVSPSGVKTPRLPPRPYPKPTQSKDWLTGDDEPESIPSHFTTPTPASSDGSYPVLRRSPSKRASFIEKSGFSIPEAVVAQTDTVLYPSPPIESPTSSTASGAPSTLSLSRANRVFPPLDTTTPELPLDGGLTDNWSPVAPKMQQNKEVESSSSADEGPEEANRYIPSSTPKTPDQRQGRSRKGRQSSVHNLVDLWGGGTAVKDREKEKESTRVTITPKTPVSSAGDLKTQRRLTTEPSRLTETKSDKPAPSASPIPLLSSVGHIARSPSMSRTASSQHTKQTSAISAPPPISSRSRPQSMFVFPSKAPETPLPSSVSLSGLSIPEERTSRPIRRTSITDMVQKYENIDANARVFLTKSSGLKTPSHSLDDGKNSTSMGTSRNDQVDGKIALLVSDEATPSRTSSVGLLSHMSTIKFPSRSSPMPVAGEKEESVSAPPLRSRQVSVKPATPAEPSGKSTEDDTASRSGERRTPSPDKPYQGVGKLIDQWQRKAESNATRTPVKRDGFVAKRAGLVSGGIGRSH